MAWASPFVPVAVEKIDSVPITPIAVLKDNRAIPLIVPVEGDAIADATKEIGERSLAVLERSPP